MQTAICWSAAQPGCTGYRHTSLAACGLALLAGLAGCAAPGRPPEALTDDIASIVRPILVMDPDAVWTEAYNRLLALRPHSIAYLMDQPAMTRPAAPDDLNVLLHTSLVRMLADPASGPPQLTASCLETTLGLLHFDLKAGGRRVGTVVIPQGTLPRTWHELYPADFDHAAAARIDLEADRQALREWWSTRGCHWTPGARHALRPALPYVWPILQRRYADRWEYLPEPRAVLCAAQAPGPPLLTVPTADYNLVRAACIWLGSSTDEAVQEQLIELLDSPSPVVAYNARFALRYSPDQRVRALLKRYDGRRQAGSGRGGPGGSAPEAQDLAP